MNGGMDRRRAARGGIGWPGRLGFDVCARWLLLAVGGAAIVSAAGSAVAWAQESEPPVRITFKADAAEGAELQFGDVVPLVLEITHSPDQTVVVGRLPRYGQWGPFEVRNQTPGRRTVNDDGTVTMRQDIEAAALGTGTLQTPDIPITVRHPDGSEETVYPFPVEVVVHSVLSGPDDPPEDIQPQADLSTPLLEQPPVRAAAAVLAAAALVAAAAGAYYLYRRRRSPGDLPLPVVDTRTPWEAAIDELDRIERLDLPEDGHFKEHYTLVAGAVRMYVHAMYLTDVSAVDAIDMTTDEIASAMRRSALGVERVRLVIDLLSECDLVKFAKYTPSVSSAYEASGQARHIVEVTRPAPANGRLEYGADARREVTA